ncbi:hypothetical protein [Hymenobacter guriensis]|uniref:Uncharacterized protein n=1 Tax=Hymenobacter guriensis TaxID=2793065 RepID=A0ABS0L6M8_9BACT|nr:hypothetical protein [Hymenobacter guriensis]MBG8555017.1 hypothetical protein [Hymenobacter guriensis]
MPSSVKNQKLNPATTQQPTATGLSQNALIIASGQYITAEDVAHQFKAGPRKAKALFKEMQHLYGLKPTFFHLALFSGTNELEAMMKDLMQARKQRNPNA